MEPIKLEKYRLTQVIEQDYIDSDGFKFTIEVYINSLETKNVAKVYIRYWGNLKPETISFIEFSKPVKRSDCDINLVHLECDTFRKNLDGCLNCRHYPKSRLFNIIKT